MTYADVLKKQLSKYMPKGLTVYMRDWEKNYTGEWKPAGKPLALLLHHTASCATQSKSAKAPGNQKGANNGTINYIQNHYDVPAANFTLDRDGTVYVHAANPVWHAGVGTFKGKPPWDTLNIPDDQGNRYMLGVEIMSQGKIEDYTKAQEKSLALLIDACAAAGGWEPLWLKNRPRHKDWTTRKIDILYSNEEVKAWIVEYGSTATE